MHESWRGHEGVRRRIVAEDGGQCCWVHKTGNILNKLPNSRQSKAKRALQIDLDAASLTLPSPSSAIAPEGEETKA
jgi:hypothetical protein